ncbi:MAG: HAD family hydrolase [Mycobacterium sp.]|nr:MAG: HAD family hydrolase [Mycobacterium sp.]
MTSRLSAPLASLHDCLLLDLDGTLFRGSQPIAGAAEALSVVTSRTLFLTNNASRSALQVAHHLRELGFEAEPDDVITSGQCAAQLLGTELVCGSAVLVVGSEALGAEVSRVGLRPVRRWADDPVALVQGFSPDICWADLAEAALAIRAGIPWVATNPDVTLPSERGLVPGNGSMVAALQAATGRSPRIVGKPYAPIFQAALSRGDFHRPLVVGDRLDTDIAGANSAGLPSLLVLSGVTTAAEALAAPPAQRPTFVAPDLSGIRADSDSLRVEGLSVSSAG